MTRTIIAAIILILAVNARGQDKTDTTRTLYSFKSLAIDTPVFAQTHNETVATIDTLNNVTVRPGWQWIMVIENGEAWVFDSTRTPRKVSSPNTWRYQ